MAETRHTLSCECWRHTPCCGTDETKNTLARCRSITELVAVQTSLVRANLKRTLDSSRRIAELTVQVADEAARTIAVEADRSADRTSRAA